MLHADLTEKIIAACFIVIKELGAGFVESVYENALVLVLREMGLNVKQQCPIEVRFRGVVVGKFIADLVVEDKVLVELKPVKALLPEHLAQTINYLKVGEIDVGLLVNFGNAKLEYRRLHR